MNSESDVLAQLHTAGIPAHSLIFDRIVRKAQDRNLDEADWYVIRRWTSQKTSKEYIFGTCGSWKTGNRVEIAPDAAAEDKPLLVEQRKIVTAQVQEETERQNAYAADHAQAEWSKASDSGKSEYLIRKKVSAHGVRFNENGMLIPMVKSGQIIGIQTISNTGEKRFSPGCAKKGSSHLIGSPSVGGLVLIAEGYATAASVYEATGWPVVVAFDCHNLEPVAHDIRKRFPKARIVIAADDDYMRPVENIGIVKATAAAKAVKGIMVAPVFANHANRGKDWNDLATIEGLAQVRRQLIDACSPADMHTLDEIEERDVRWLWPGVIPFGMLSMIAGKQGLGKSFLVSDIAARFSSGREMPSGFIPEDGKPGKVLLLAREDPVDCVIRPRVRAAGGYMRRIFCSEFRHPGNGKMMDVVGNERKLIDMVHDHGVRLVVVDTYAAFAGTGSDQNSAGDVRAVLDALSMVARATGAAVVVVAHLRKPSAGQRNTELDPMDSIAGSAQMTAGVRVASMLEEAKSRDEGVRWFRPVKSNVGKINPDGWTWTLSGEEGDMPTIRWDEAAEGMHYTEKQRRSNGGIIDEDTISELLVRRLEKGAQRLAGIARDVHAELVSIPGQNRASKASVEAAIRRIGMLGNVCVIGEGARKDSEVIALPGMLPETPPERAARIALENPDMTAKDLQKASGCRKEICLEAIRNAKDARFQSSKLCGDLVPEFPTSGTVGRPGAVPDFPPPYKGGKLGSGTAVDSVPDLDGD